jgi:enoyl-CoA hydratase/carnithine racemase
MSADLEIAREDRVLRITLNREKKRNALSVEMCNALASAIEDTAADASIGAVLIAAKGDVFCAGMDLDEVMMEGAAEATAAAHERVFTLGARTRKPIVAAVNGPTLGGGVGLVANCHIAVAAQGSSFGLTEIRIGMWPFFIWRSVAVAMGERRATALALTGRIFSANEALQFGLIHEIAPAFEVDDRATATAIHLSELAPAAIAAGLDFITQCHTADPATQGHLARRFRSAAFRSGDLQEGITAFKEKRKPLWPK